MVGGLGTVERQPGGKDGIDTGLNIVRLRDVAVGETTVLQSFSSASRKS